MNYLLERKQKLQGWFEKVDLILQENFEVISHLLVPKEKKD